jgi:lysophospholipase L1-like esterase
VTFVGGQSRNFTVPAGALVVSDPVSLDLPAGANLSDAIVTISLYLATGQPGTGGITSHPGSRTTSYFARGDWTGAADVAAAANATGADTATADHWYFISGVSAYVQQQPHGASTAAAALVVLGDSISDGRGSTTNGNDRWPDVLSRRLLLVQQQQQQQAASSSSASASSSLANYSTAIPAITVLNLAAGGNRVLYDGLGPNLAARIERDALARVTRRSGGGGGVRWAIVLEGVNDLGTAGADAASQEGEVLRVTAAYAQLVWRLRRAGIAVFGATITPFGGEGQVYDDSDGAVGGGERERARQAVNAWIRQPGHFDSVVDFDAVVRDAERPERLNADFDSGDHLHPNVAGYQAMGDAVDLRLFARFADGADDTAW